MTTLRILSLVDERFAKGLAVLVQSAAEQLRAGWRLQFDVLDLGVTAATRRRLERTGDAFGDRCQFALRSPARLPSGAAIMALARELRLDRYALSCFLKLTAFEECAADGFALYLDTDILVRTDLAALAEIDCGGAPLAAVVDAVKEADSAAGRVFDFRAMGLDPSAPFFNGGVLWLDIGAWRRQSRFRRALEIAPKLRRAFSATTERPGAFTDQDVLNVLFHNEWHQLVPAWNRQCPFGYGVLHEGPENRLLHYVTRPKPWEMLPSGDSQPFYDLLDRTGFRGWRPHPWWTRIRGRLSYLKYLWSQRRMAVRKG